MAEINLSRQLKLVSQIIKDFDTNAATMHSLKGAIYDEGKKFSDKKALQKIEIPAGKNS